MDVWLDRRLAALVVAEPVEWTPRAGGYSTAERYTVTLADGRRVFAKAADAEHMAAWLRREHEVYASLRGSFIPDLIGFDDDGTRPLSWSRTSAMPTGHPRGPRSGWPSSAQRSTSCTRRRRRRT